MTATSHLTPLPQATRRSALAACGAVAAAALLAGCAAFTPATPEEAVKQRATERWQALIKGDYKAAYGYLAPSVRSVNDYERYRASFGAAIKWLEVEVVNVACEPEKCSARIKIVSAPHPSLRFPANITSGIDETWLLEDGKWWFYQKL